MELIELLNKYSRSFSYAKSVMYKEVEAHKSDIVENGFGYKIKNEADLFLYEVLYRSIDNEQQIKATYNNFVAMNYDIFEHMNYFEKQKIINHDIQEKCQELVSFTFQKEEIYIPHLEPFMNRRYLTEYQMLTLKQHQEYITTFTKELTNIHTMYGLLPYVSDFSSLSFLGRDDQNSYFYWEESQRVYVFDASAKIVKEIACIDKYHKYNPEVTVVKDVLVHLLESKDDQEVLTYMQEKGCISDKAYRKISKKLG